MISTKKMTFLTSLGAGLEYFDFITYGLLASYLEQLFFPNHDNAVGLLQVFAIFALGYFIRPVGGMLFGHFADRYGRKKIFLISLSVMAVATFAMGLLPTYAQVGLLAPLLLIICRLLQGMAFGAELPGAATFLVEHSHQHQRGLHIGLTMAGVSLGAMLGSAMLYMLNQYFTPAEMLAYGWRIPFWLGGVLAIISFWLRKRLRETPVFIQQAQTAKQQQPVRIVFAQYPRQLILGIFITLFSACFIIFGVGLPAYLHTFYGYTISDVYFWVTIGFVWSALILPLFGALSDRIGRAKLLALTALILIVSSYALFNLLTWRNNVALGTFILLYQTFIAALASCYMTTLPEIFPTSVRFTGVAICYNIAYSIASLTPFILTKLAASAGGPQFTFLFFSLLAITTLIASRYIQPYCLGELKTKTNAFDEKATEY